MKRRVTLFVNNQFYKEVEIENQWDVYKTTVLIGEGNYGNPVKLHFLDFTLQNFRFGHTDFTLGICLDKDLYVADNHSIKENRRKKERRRS